MIALGTAQFGMNYGATNFVEQPCANEVGRILEIAYSNNIRLIDTAADYGLSEHVLGSCGVSRFQVMTKLPSAIAVSTDVGGWVKSSVENSMANLSISKLDSVFLHRSEQILNEVTGHEVLMSLTQLKTDGIVDRIGVSVYDPEELDQVFRIFTPDIVQIPLNVFDTRFVESGHVSRCRDLGVVIVGRSTFLQGLLLSRSHKINNLDELATLKLDGWHNWISDNGLDSVAESIGFCHSCGVDHILVGVNSYFELQHILDRNLESIRGGFSCLYDHSQRLIDPRKWS
jgi:aryl-alcohol dehydrogenase-like predicted oxidoreductase